MLPRPSTTLTQLLALEDVERRVCVSVVAYRRRACVDWSLLRRRSGCASSQQRKGSKAMETIGRENSVGGDRVCKDSRLPCICHVIHLYPYIHHPVYTYVLCVVPCVPASPPPLFLPLCRHSEFVRIMRLLPFVRGSLSASPLSTLIGLCVSLSFPQVDICIRTV